MKLPKYVSLNGKFFGRESKLKYVGKFFYKNTEYYCGCHKTIKEAQIAVDIKRCELGLEPVILKRKN